MIATQQSSIESNLGILVTLLPGPSRKRYQVPYQYRITYRSPLPGDVGCVMTWSVHGGRESYQIALERLLDGNLRWHCTCPDAVYRSGVHEGHRCKHVQGLIECSPPVED